MRRLHKRRIVHRSSSTCSSTTCCVNCFSIESIFSCFMHFRIIIINRRIDGPSNRRSVVLHSYSSSSSSALRLLRIVVGHSFLER